MIVRLSTKSIADVTAVLLGGVGTAVIWLYHTRWRRIDDQLDVDFGGDD